MINLFEPSLTEKELQAIKEVFDNKWIGRGKKTAQFEAAWAKHISTFPIQVVATNCCTEALFEAVKLAVLPGDEVIIPAIHFAGAYQAIKAHGAIPIICDVDERSLNTHWGYIEPLLTYRTKAVLLLSYGGIPCNIWNIRDCLPERIKIIEDAACSPIGEVYSFPTSTFANFSCWSFDAMKMMTTGDGGMLYCAQGEHAKIARCDMYLGMDTVSGFDSDNPRWWEYQIAEVGRRAIMNDIVAAIGLVQLERLPALVDRRRILWQIYNEQLNGVGDLVLPPPLPEFVTAASYYFYWIQTDRRDELATYLKKRDIYTSFRYYPLHWAAGIKADVPNAERTAKRTLLLPCHANITNADYICQCVKEFFDGR